MTSDQEPDLRVDPASLHEAARTVTEAPALLELMESEPGTGETSTAAELAAFLQSYRTAAGVLTTDDTATAEHLRIAVDTYLAHDTYRTAA
jgi:hypothetical protein